jgi:SAM-dependent methyltransferase
MKPDNMPVRANTDTAWRQLHAAACAPYKSAGRFAWHWARGKLGRDPAFRGMLARGDLPPNARVVDIGCGQGLVASLLTACADMQAQNAWPSAWPQHASYSAYTGIELMQAAVGRGQNALRGLQPAPQLLCADMRTAALPACDVVVILDVLHYVNHAEQNAVLARVREALSRPAGANANAKASAKASASSNGTTNTNDGARPGRLLLRVGDADNTRGFAISQWVDKVVTFCGGHRTPPTWGRPLAEWVAQLQSLGFVVQTVPMSQGTPFANVLLVADLQGGPSA